MNKKYINIILQVVFTLLIITPILGAIGVFPAPTADLYTNQNAFNFISIMMNSYVVYGIAIMCASSIVALWSGRRLLSMLLILPLTVNVIGFHATLDGGLFTGGAIMGNVLLLLNVYFLYQDRAQLSVLLKKK